MISMTRSAVSRPSPVVDSPSRKMTCPDCSPPRVAPDFSISSSTYLSPTLARSMRTPELRSAISRPMLDIVVATTREPASTFRAFISRAANNKTPSPFTTRPSASLNNARSASPSKVTPRSNSPFLPATTRATVSGCRAPQFSLMFLPSGEALRNVACTPESRNSSGASAVAAPCAQSTRTRNRLRSALTLVANHSM